MMNNIMLDLETMGNGPMAAIVAIGAVEFDIGTCELGREFYRVVDLESSMRLGGVVDASTVMWWLGQSLEARCGINPKFGKCSLSNALIDFRGWVMQGVEDCDDVLRWGNGATFDNVILSSAYRNAELERPWRHWGDRCYRTVKSFFPQTPIERIGVHHNALDDAKSQALHLIEMIGQKPDISDQSVQ